jgi:hypothetical protein
MGFFQSFFGSGGASKSPANSSQMRDSQLSSGMSQQLMASQNTTRRELLRVVLRDTMNRHGIPTAWVTPEILSTTSRNGERGVHWRLHVKHWDARLLEHTVGIQNALIKRVLTFDPLAANWLNGISWQLSLDDESMCPPLPPAPTWTLQQQARPAAAEPQQPIEVDVIEGPVHIQAKGVDARADLDQLLAVRDADFQRHAADGTPHPFAPTEPSKL